MGLMKKNLINNYFLFYTVLKENKMSSSNLNTEIMSHNCSLCPKTKQNELNINATDNSRFVCNQCYTKYKIEHIFSLYGLTDTVNDMFLKLINEKKLKKQAEAKLKLQELMKSLEDDLDEKTIQSINNTINTKPKTRVYPEGITEQERQKIYDDNRKGRTDKKKKVKCICSMEVCIGSMSPHIKTKKHRDLLDINKDNISHEDLNETDWKKWSTVIESRSNTSSTSSTNSSTGYNSDDDEKEQ